MGMDLYGVKATLSVNCSTWRVLLDLAFIYGWQPKGTIGVGIEEWDGSLESATELEWLAKKHELGDYYSNNGYIVTKTDALALAKALESAICNRKQPNVYSQVDFTIDNAEKLAATHEKYVADLLRANNAGNALEFVLSKTDDKIPTVILTDLIAICKAGPFRLL